MYKMKKGAFVILFLSLFGLSFALGIHDTESFGIIEEKIMENPKVSWVKVRGMNGDSYPFTCMIKLVDGGSLSLTEFDKNLSGVNLRIYLIDEYEFVYGQYIEKIPDDKGILHGYRMNEIRTDVLSIVLNKKIRTVNDIINNYNEIYTLAETLSKETPEERTKRRKVDKIQNDPNFINELGNFENDECWGQIFVRHKSEAYESMFVDK